MNKNFSFFLIFVTVFCFACKKHETRETTDGIFPNSAELISNSKGVIIYRVGVQIGHPASGCSDCVTTGGVHHHVECQGSGNACSARAIMRISETGEVNLYYGTIDDPDELTFEDFFNMPDRSLYIIGSNGEFLNIPEQMLYRDEETGTFIMYDIFFSDVQMFVNE